MYFELKASPAGSRRDFSRHWPSRAEQARRAALVDYFLNHYNHDRPHAGIGHQPPISRVPLRTYRLPDTGITIPVTATFAPEQLALDLDAMGPMSRDTTASHRRPSSRHCSP
ncbi:hypothetical protein [Nocardia aurantiaca]|uniref:Uncharacterized protein n=1 Tax=Nocardia aurantiaca TaxID=2675850 RepID=A0A6I3L408_9NOCA|nr:hypothetical protein [Nocardia aurantiaca]MTE16281.1 hypothetical protein [Nocardia aurantiaca]